MGTAKKSFTVLISLMKEQICLFLLLCVPTLTQCFPVTAAQDLSNICDLINAPTSSPISTKGQQNVGEHHAKWGTIVGGVLCLVLIVSGLIAFFCSKKKDRDRNQQPASDSGVTLPLRNMQSSGETSERDTDCDPGLTDGSPPSQRDHGV
ncbi:uncharacterized protein LOC121903875 isoform X4 [Thunnus maccoyii]|uniref:uncharacterized protein LOC121903875 isoform X4 n=1 Tax=Thunnus maccoyii TaxID=8240 RepID=UPI001C4B5BFF|nr:uncharacterized protein LOC121903875 isoform X4 [Thunnus maccoyii]